MPTRQTPYKSKIPTRTSPTVMEFFRRQAGTRSAGSAVDAAVAWIISDPTRLSEFRAYCDSQAAEAR